jgi:hypothetical protein
VKGLRLSEEELKGIQNRSAIKKPSKLHNQPLEVDGYRFASKHEANRYMELKLLLTAGQIQDLRIHPRYRIEVNGQKICDFVPDFDYFQKGKLVVEDTKGMHFGDRWEMFRLKCKLFKAVYGIDVVVI